MVVIFQKDRLWGDILLSTIVGNLVGAIGGEGALNANYLNHAKKTAGFIRAAGLYDNVLTKVVTDGERLVLYITL